MEWPYAYNSSIWPLAASAAVMAALGLYALRHRAAPGAIPFFFLAATSILWVLAYGMEQISTTDEARILWFKAQSAILLPTTTAAFCFSLEYAGLGKWLTRRSIAMLAVMPIMMAILVPTNQVHSLVWTRVWFDGYVHADFGPANWLVVVYGYFLSLIHVIVLARLFVRSPRHRLIAGWLILAPLITRGAYILRILDLNPLGPIDPVVIAINIAIVPYSLALFGFHMLDVAFVARDTVVESMREGIMAIDGRGRIADLNKIAQTFIGVDRSRAIGRLVTDVLQAYPRLLEVVHDSNQASAEVFVGNAGIRWIQASTSPLIDRRGFHIGRLVWFHDITELKEAQKQLLDQQRMLAMHEERELLAREMHDGIGQVVAAAHLQIKLAIGFLSRGDNISVERCLNRISELTQEAKESIRNYLFGVKAVFPLEKSFIDQAREYLDHFKRNYGTCVELMFSTELAHGRIDAALWTRLQPIIQEALINARKHAGVSSARVNFSSNDGMLQVSIEEADGRGFHPEDLGGNSGFGLRSMKGRAEAMGGHFELSSAHGQGTRVIVRVPFEMEAT